MQSMHILISGSSIAGPALAFWLRRHGIEVTVVERAPALREGGYFVDVRGSALEVVERMGLTDTLRSLESDTLTNALVDEKGRRFGRTPRGFGVIDAGDIEILRGDLSRVLYEATRADVRYRFGESITAIDQTTAGVVATFASGKTETFDAVVGADGVHSRTRSLAFGPEGAFVRPLGSTMAVFTVPNHLALDREQLLYMGIGRIASIKSADHNSTLKVVVFFTSPPEAGELREPAEHGGIGGKRPRSFPEAFDPRDVPAQRKLVASAFADAGWEFPKLVEGMWEASDFYCDITCQVRMAAFYEGRVALLGDAAYCPSPLSGQGTSLALAGAYVLAAELAKRNDPRTAFEAYDRAMRGFVLRNQDIALKVGDGFAPQTPFQVRARRLGMSLLPYMPGGRVVMKLAMRGIRDAARALDLPRAP